MWWWLTHVYVKGVYRIFPHLMIEENPTTIIVEKNDVKFLESNRLHPTLDFSRIFTRITVLYLLQQKLMKKVRPRRHKSACELNQSQNYQNRNLPHAEYNRKPSTANHRKCRSQHVPWKENQSFDIAANTGTMCFQKLIKVKERSIVLLSDY